MALTIQQIQNNITNKQDAREIINQIADYLQSATGGSSYLVWDSAYQNSAMSSPVGAYLWKDASDNIWQVYEPTRNNTVSRSQVDYADSIDQFPFDNEKWFNNVYNDVKILNQSGRAISQASQLSQVVINLLGVGSNPITFASIDQGTKTFTIDASFGDLSVFLSSLYTGDIKINIYGSTGNDREYNIDGNNISFDGTNTLMPVIESIPSSVADGGISGFSLINHIHKGEYGEDGTNGAELYITGDNVYIANNSVGCASYFDSVGDFTSISKSDFQGYVDCDFGDNGIIIDRCSFLNAAVLAVHASGCKLSSIQMNAASGMDINAAVSLQGTTFDTASYANITQRLNTSYVGVNADVDTTNGYILRSNIGDSASYSPSSDQQDKVIIKIGSTTYEMGESSGNATLTPV